MPQKRKSENEEFNLNVEKARIERQLNELSIPSEGKNKGKNLLPVNDVEVVKKQLIELINKAATKEDLSSIGKISSKLNESCKEYLEKRFDISMKPIIMMDLEGGVEDAIVAIVINIAVNLAAYALKLLAVVPVFLYNKVIGNDLNKAVNEIKKDIEPVQQSIGSKEQPNILPEKNLRSTEIIYKYLKIKKPNEAQESKKLPNGKQDDHKHKLPPPPPPPRSPPPPPPPAP